MRRKSIATTQSSAAKYSKYFNGDVKYLECLSGAFIKRPTDEDNNSCTISLRLSLPVTLIFNIFFSERSF